MKAARIIAPRKVEIIDIPRPELGPADVLVKVKVLGLCGSDLNTYRGLNPLVRYPRIPGHEIAGEVVSTGSQVKGKVERGAVVSISPYTACGNCYPCTTGRPNTCRNNQTMGNQREGAAVEYIIVPSENILLPEIRDPDKIALIEPLSVGLHGCNRAAVTGSDLVLVIGCGVIGLGAILAASYKGATVIAADISDNKLEKAKSVGASMVINSKDNDLKEIIQELTRGRWPGVVIEAVGLPQTFTQAIDVVDFSGRVVYIGYCKEPVTYETKYFVARELDIRGSRNALRSEMEEVAVIIDKVKLDPGVLITHRFTLGEIDKAFDLWDRHPEEVCKIVIDS